MVASGAAQTLFCQVLLIIGFKLSTPISCVYYLRLISVQALASEREFVIMLLDPDAVVDSRQNEDHSSKSLHSDFGKAESDLTFVLDRIFEGVCRPFKVRVEQVLQSQPSLIISYKLSNTLEFYSYTVSLVFLVFDIK